MKKNLEQLIHAVQNESARFNADELLELGISKAGDPSKLELTKPSIKIKTLLLGAATAILSIFLINTAIHSSSDTVTSDTQTMADNERTVKHAILDDSKSSADTTASLPTDNTLNATVSELDSSPDHSFNPTSGPGHPNGTLYFSQSDWQPLKGDIEKLLQIQSLKPQTYTIDTRQDTILKLDKGTLIHLESYCFQDSTGRVIAGQVQFKAKECYSLSDMVHENLSTQSANGLLETGGMFYTEATQGGRSLQLRPGYELGLTPNYWVPERMDFYNGTRNAQNDMVWNKDPLGRVPNPILIVVGGKYETVLDTFFYKNYRFEKSDMLKLLDSTFTLHFTSQDREIIGLRACDNSLDACLKACEFFNDQLAVRLAKMSTFPPQSRLTEFKFMCMSKNKYAYAMSKGYVDSFVNYVPPSDYNYLDLSLPLFYSGQLGSLNIDCVPELNLSFKWNKLNKPKKNDLSFEIPGHLRTNSFLILKDINAIARASNTKNDALTFGSIEEDHEALLVITAYYNDEFYVFSEKFNTGETLRLPKVNFRKIEDADEYNRWLESTISGKSE